MKKKLPCTCVLPQHDDSSEHVTKFPGDKEYICEYCGVYRASKPRCNKCEEF